MVRLMMSAAYTAVPPESAHGPVLNSLMRQACRAALFPKSGTEPLWQRSAEAVLDQAGRIRPGARWRLVMRDQKLKIIHDQARLLQGPLSRGL